MDLKRRRPCTLRIEPARRCRAVQALAWSERPPGLRATTGKGKLGHVEEEGGVPVEVVQEALVPWKIRVPCFRFRDRDQRCSAGSR